jgi:NTE family protein
MQSSSQKTFLIIIVLLLFSDVFNLKAQLKENERPKVGLVLSGGGAKGLAHMGVLKVLEEVGIFPDYISGTSMGSIVGGLYAIGYSAADLSRLNRTVDWNVLLSDYIPLRNIALDEKHDYKRYIVELPIRNKKITLPSGVLEGQNLTSLLSGLTWRTAGIDSFDHFPIPYRCVGTEIVNGEVYEFKSGDLVTAMRASMAIPSIFTPVVIDTDKVIVDGGVIRNFPVEEVRNMGADIVIGVYVGFKEKVTADDLNSMDKVLARSTSSYGIYDAKEQLKYVDILITPELENYSSGDFNKYQTIEDAGEAAARKQYDKLKTLADSLAKYNDYRRPEPPEEKDSLFITSVSVNDLKYNDQSLVYGKLDIGRNVYITRDKLQSGIELLFGTLYFEKLTYRFEKENLGYRLFIDAKEKPPASMKVSVHYDNFYGPGLMLNYTQSNFLISGARLTVSGDISEYPQFHLYYRKYAGKRMNILASFDSRYESNLIPGYIEGKEVGYFRQNHSTSELALKNSINLNQHAGIGLLFEYSTVYPNKSMQTLYPEALNYKRYGFYGFGLTGNYSLNTLDDMLYPFEGNRFDIYLKGIYNPWLDLKYLTDTIKTEPSLNSFGKLYMDLDSYNPLGRRYCLNFGFSAGLSTDEYITSDYFYVGGYKYNLRRNHQAYVGYSLGEIVVSNFLAAKLGLYYRFFKNVQAEIVTNGLIATQSFQELVENMFRLNKENAHLGYGAGITYKSPVGPLSIFVANNNKDDHLRWYVNLGFTF